MSDDAALEFWRARADDRARASSWPHSLYHLLGERSVPDGAIDELERILLCVGDSEVAARSFLNAATKAGVDTATLHWVLEWMAFHDDLDIWPVLALVKRHPALLSCHYGIAAACLEMASDCNHRHGIPLISMLRNAAKADPAPFEHPDAIDSCIHLISHHEAVHRDLAISVLGRVSTACLVNNNVPARLGPMLANIGNKRAMQRLERLIARAEHPSARNFATELASATAMDVDASPPSSAERVVWWRPRDDAPWPPHVMRTDGEPEVKPDDCAVEVKREHEENIADGKVYWHWGWTRGDLSVQHSGYGWKTPQEMWAFSAREKPHYVGTCDDRWWKDARIRCW